MRLAPTVWHESLDAMIDNFMTTEASTRSIPPRSHLPGSSRVRRTIPKKERESRKAERAVTKALKRYNKKAQAKVKQEVKQEVKEEEDLGALQLAASSSHKRTISALSLDEEEEKSLITPKDCTPPLMIMMHFPMSSLSRSRLKPTPAEEFEAEIKALDQEDGDSGSFLWP